MNYGTIKKCDIANGAGVRCTLFVSGCTNKCKNCFQPETWDFNYGKPFDKEAILEIMHELEKPYVKGLTLLGGDPFEPANQKALLPFIREMKAMFPNKDIWAFTGFRLDDELLVDGSYPRCEATDELLSYVDVLVDGRYVDELHDISLRFRGSSNQRLIDMNETRKQGKIVIWDDKLGK
ncbi:MAG: anaerobic ribonucleoside-triphosphate reductase activating protein [Oscillospiraceae bacterium]|nr:anaerobic ribonucleoside-triphosphate reductase activating protein [Oscillospiraceae bacterium]